MEQPKVKFTTTDKIIPCKCGCHVCYVVETTHRNNRDGTQTISPAYLICCLCLEKREL